MDRINRRGFLGLAAGATAMTALSPSIARAAAIPADRRTGTIADVEHIVVLMQENRSFDHYFGSLRGVRGFGDRTPVTKPDGESVWHQNGVLPFRPDIDDLGLAFLQDLPHGWNDGHAAFDGGKYDRWVPAKGPTTMAYLTREDIPFHYALADQFTICDAYHCSLMGPTDPNRYYMWTGYTGNDGKGGGPVVTNDELGYGWTTYPERLEAAGVSWKIYQDAGEGLDAAGSWGWTSDPYVGNYGDNSLLYFNQYRTAAPGSPADPKLPHQERGLRPARPLPYDLAADARFGAELTITFASRGNAGAVFHTTTAGGDPRTFTAAARTHLTGTWPAGADVTVHGPNGFVRRFRAAGVEATTRQGRLTLANPSARPARVVLTDTYGGDRTVIRLNPGQSQVRHLPLCEGWYDLTLTSDLDPHYLRRLVGNVEPGVSQP